MNLQIKKEFKELIPELTREEYIQLENNCIEHGIQDSIKVWHGYVIDGHNRYEIAQKNKLEYRIEELDFDNENDVKEWMILNQFGRRNLSNYQRSVLALQLEDVFKAKAKENQGSRIDICQKSDKSITPIDTKKELAKVAQVSHDTIAKVKHIEQKAAPEVKAKLATGEVSINQAYQEIKKEEKKKEFEEKIIEQKNEINKGLKKIDGLYDIISVDPPWPYGRAYDPDGSRVANPYPEMEINDIIKNIPPFSNDSICFLWTTHKFLPNAFDILDKWGFDYKATIVWDKEKIGMGAWVRMQCEFVLIGIKGKPLWHNTTERDIIRESRREHSRKPDAFFNMIDKICAGKKLEFYSREQRDGWDVYGNDVNKF